MSKPFTPMSESAVLRTLMVYASDFACRLFRNARGVERIAQKDCKSCQRFGRVVSYGLANGAPDLVGWVPHVVTDADVGRTLAVFVGIEAKRKIGGVVSDEQRTFLAALARDGAVCGVARSIGDLDGILGPWEQETK